MASPRSKARQRALEILFEADLRGVLERLAALEVRVGALETRKDTE